MDWTSSVRVCALAGLLPLELHFDLWSNLLTLGNRSKLHIALAQPQLSSLRCRKNYSSEQKFPDRTRAGFPSLSTIRAKVCLGFTRRFG